MPGQRKGIDYTNLSDDELVSLCQKGDLSAFEAIVRRYQGLVINYLYKILGNQADAEDGFQETFFKVLKNIGQYQSKENFRGWLLTIAHNLSINYLKSKEHQQVPLTDKILAKIQTARPGDKSEIERKDLQAIINDALRSLPTGQREVIILRIYHGMSYQEIAQFLKVPKGTVGYWISEGLKALSRPLSILRDR